MIQPTEIDMIIHEPIFTDSMSKEQLEGLTETVKARIQAGLT